MNRKILFICMTAVILQMCFFTGCNDDKSKETSENELSVSKSETLEISQTSSEISSDIKSETPNSSTITNTEKDTILTEMDIENDISKTSQTVLEQSDKVDTADKSNNNKAVTTKSTTTHKETGTTAKNLDKTTTPDLTNKNDISKETTTEVVTTAISSKFETIVTTQEAIELPEIEFD